MKSSSFRIAGLFVLTAGFASLLQAANPGAERLAAGLANRFKQLDRNADGRLDGEELNAHPMLKMLDQNADGVVTLEEAQAFFAKGAAVPPASPASESPAAPSPREEPQRLKGGEYGVGSQIPDVRFKDLDGREVQLSALQNRKPLIVALFSPSCPVSKRYLPTLARLAAEARQKEVGLLLVAPLATESAEELRAALKAAGLRAPCVPDATGALARTLGATSTTDAFLLDGARTLVYRGAVDDQYGLGYSLDAPKHAYLTAALDALLGGRTPDIAATQAPGCALDLEKAAAVTSAPTYHNRISRILQSNCVECHRKGGIAPFALETYEQVNAKAGMIRKMVDRKLMPPWFAAEPAKGEHSPWANDRSLAERDRSDLLTWLGNGKPEGDPKDAPLPRTWPGEWKIGTPDAVVQIPQPIEVNATGVMPYQNVSVETGFTEDKWVRGFEVQPTAKEVVHHVLVFVQEKGSARPSHDGVTKGFFAAYVPGNNSIVYPDGLAKPLPAGARLFFQIHYTPNGTATKDQTRIGLLFAKEAPEHTVHVAGIANLRFAIPPGADNHPVTGSIPVLRPVKVLALMPHMHLRGKAFRYEAVLPDGTTKTLLDVPRYDFNWQLAYRYAEPLTLPFGAKVQATGWFDNSAGNPANPDPAKEVHWGPQTTDEMMLGYVEYYFADEKPAKPTPALSLAR